MRYLVTTTVKETWPQYSDEVVFLGEWCKLHAARASWSLYNSKTADYHWDDRSKLQSDYLYLTDLKEQKLAQLGRILNHAHNVNYPTEYWRVFIGPWVGVFIQILYDRWFMIRQSIQLHSTTHIKLIVHRDDERPSWDMEEFCAAYSTDPRN